VVPLAAWRQSHDEQGGEVNESTRMVEESRENIGASVMGRNMFGPVGGGAWGDEQWTGTDEQDQGGRMEQNGSTYSGGSRPNPGPDETVNVSYDIRGARIELSE
jgi:hypothetical protein